MKPEFKVISLVEPTQKTEKSTEKNLAKRTILIVDDGEMTRDVLVQALNIMGYNPISAENGLTALNMVKSDKPDLVITDIHMSKMNGLELLREIRNYDPDIPVILITGFDADEARLAAQEYEAIALITKPFRLNQLSVLMDKIFAE